MTIMTIVWAFFFAAVRPNMDSYVFLRVNEDTDGVLVEEETLDTG